MEKAILIGCILFFASCRTTVDSVIKYELIYTNETDHTIWIKGYKDYYNEDELILNLLLQKGESGTHWSNLEEGTGPMPSANRVSVTWDDTITIRHGGFPPGVELIPVKRNLFDENSYIVTSTGKNKFRCEYTFTEEDYQVALAIYLKENP